MCCCQLAVVSPIACKLPSHRSRSARFLRLLLVEGGTGVFDFTVLVIFEIGFSVFALKISGFSVLVSVAVFGFYLFSFGFQFL